jgi:hypothetical protein
MTEIEKQILIDCLERRRKELGIDPVQQPKTLAVIISLIGRFQRLECGGVVKTNGTKPHSPKLTGRKLEPVEVETKVPSAKAVKEALRQAERIVEMCEEVAEYDSSSAVDFAEGVREQTEAIAATIEERGDVTDGQWVALDNMESGISRWVR